MIGLLIGILVAVAIFGATLFSLHQAVTTKTLQRYANIACIICVIGAMASISNLQAGLAQFLGGALAVAAGITIIKTPGWSRLLPIVLFGFAIALLLRIPFA